MSDEPKDPQPPEELWMLWSEKDGWILSLDATPSNAVHMVFFSEQSAQRESSYYHDGGPIPVRVK